MELLTESLCVHSLRSLEETRKKLHSPSLYRDSCTRRCIAQLTPVQHLDHCPGPTALKTVPTLLQVTLQFSPEPDHDPAVPTLPRVARRFYPEPDPVVALIRAYKPPTALTRAGIHCALYPERPNHRDHSHPSASLYLLPSHS
eukprot:2254223-Rhodomonas_salina.2